MKLKVRNMSSPRTGNPIANQFIIEVGAYTYFQSYSSIIVRKGPKGTSLDRDTWEYSVTTAKYRNEFLGENTQETRRKIKSGEYKLVNLNRES